MRISRRMRVGPAGNRQVAVEDIRGVLDDGQHLEASRADAIELHAVLHAHAGRHRRSSLARFRPFASRRRCSESITLMSLTFDAVFSLTAPTSISVWTFQKSVIERISRR